MNNADWEELIAILDPLTPKDLDTWSKAWVDQPGMPQIKTSINLNKEGDCLDYCLIQSKKPAESSKMGMKIALSRFFPDKKEEYNVELTGDTTEFPVPYNQTSNNLILPNSDGKGYGTFYPDSLSLQILLDSSIIILDNLTRASWFVMRNELFFNGKIDSEKYYSLLFSNLLTESEPQIRQYLLNALEIVWWNYFNPEQRKFKSTLLESSLNQLLSSKEINVNERKPIFWTFARIATTGDAINQIYNVWSNKIKIEGVNPDESDFMILACELAVRDFGNSDSIIKAQEKRILNTDRLAKFRYMEKSVTSDSIVRDSFFKSLSDPANRRPEPWVTEALHYFHHPLRADYSIKFLKPALDILPEIQRTGDIFFPKSWLDVTLSGYSSKEAFRIVDVWLKDNQGLPKTLRDKVMQSADNLRRANEKHF
jgi:aminopeptidase N